MMKNIFKSIFFYNFTNYSNMKLLLIRPYNYNIFIFIPSYYPYKIQ